MTESIVAGIPVIFASVKTSWIVGIATAATTITTITTDITKSRGLTAPFNKVLLKPYISLSPPVTKL